MTRSHFALAVIVALIGVLLFGMLVAAYISGYTQRGRFGTIAGTGGTALVRTYPTRLEAELFGPGAFIESMIRGRRVNVGHLP